jgi:Glycosyl hydrolases family 43
VIRRLLAGAVAALVVTTAVTGLPAAAAPKARAHHHAATSVTTTTIQNDDATGQVSRFDVDGNSLDAHDGSILQVGAVFYLYGTSYACGYRYEQNSSFCGFKVYSSPDLAHWTDRGYVLAPGACGFCFRAHVVFNAGTHRYVMWADGGGQYIVATSPTPTGLFTRQPNPTLAVGGAVDESLFVDDDGTGYLIHNTTQVDAGLTADMVVEKLTPDYLNTNGQSTRLGLGDVEAFTVFKRDGVYHALMSDPTCAYCSGGTGEMTATSMLGAWSGAWFDPNGVHQSGRAEPRWRARIVNADSCGGQPLASIPVVSANGSTTYYFVSDRWNNRAPNESLANLFIGPMSFDAAGTLQAIPCTSSFTLALAAGPGGTYNQPLDVDQSSGFDGFHHYCDIAGTVERQQLFVASRTGTLSSASVTTFQSGTPNAPLTLDVVDAASNEVLSREDLPVATVPWAPNRLPAHPGVAVAAGHAYLLRLHSSTTSGCYGWEYNDSNPYPSGNESYSVDSGGSFTAETSRDLKFSTSVSATPAFSPDGLPAGFTLCAGEAGHCPFTGTRVVAYGVGNSANSYLLRTASDGIDCGIVGFGRDPDVGVLKSCYLAPTGGPSGYTACASEGGVCASGSPALVAYGSNGAFTYQLLTGAKACTNAAFNADPIPGVAKGCYLAPAGGPAGWTSCATENGTCAGSGPRTVVYGARGAFYARWVTGSISCSNAAFSGDPVFGLAKGCYQAA